MKIGKVLIFITAVIAVLAVVVGIINWVHRVSIKD